MMPKVHVRGVQLFDSHCFGRPTMLCKVCQGMLYGQNGRVGAGSQLQLDFEHHKSLDNVRSAAEKSGCYLCRVIYNKILQNSAAVLGAETVTNGANEDSNVGVYLISTLRPLRRVSGAYKLDFRRKASNEVIASFVLKENEAATPRTLPARPISSSTNDRKVFDLAKDWIEECVGSHEKCRAGAPWHPTRLIDLQSMLQSNQATEVVQLVSQKESERKSQEPFDGRYMTLSHCWGEASFTKLTQTNLPDFQNAILLKDLPRTFQDAIRFTCELGIRWLWIDALCILQKNEEDWLFESARMYQVYANSYCNISATAAVDSSKGLFNARDSSQRWVENIALNTTDLSGGSQSLVECTILDLSFWEECVDQAPANRRSWVFQERILAPRVIHWCRDQIAFECREIDRAECRPEGLPHYQMKGEELIDGARLKAFDQAIGKRLRDIRLATKHSSSNSQALQGMITEVDQSLYFYELWKRVVEVYTKMDLTDKRDRLIALSGIARMMTATMKSVSINDQYAAGMWKNHMGSQLLWYVNEGTGTGRQPFVNTRPPKYRAPTFSWASVESNRGITFAETTDKGLQINVEVVRLTYRKRDDMFGLLTDGYIVLRGVLRRVELFDAQELVKASSEGFRVMDVNEVSGMEKYYQQVKFAVRSHDLRLYAMMAIGIFSIHMVIMFMIYGTYAYDKMLWAILLSIPVTGGQIYHSNKQVRVTELGETEDPGFDESKNRYSWRLMLEGQAIGRKYETIYLDSPASSPTIFGPLADVFVLPALKNDRHLICLLLQATGGDYGIRYKRVGLTTIQTLYSSDIRTIITPPGNSDDSLGEYYWGPAGKGSGVKSTICII